MGWDVKGGWKVELNSEGMAVAGILIGRVAGVVFPPGPLSLISPWPEEEMAPLLPKLLKLCSVTLCSCTLC